MSQPTDNRQQILIVALAIFNNIGNALTVDDGPVGRAPIRSAQQPAHLFQEQTRTDPATG